MLFRSLAAGATLTQGQTRPGPHPKDPRPTSRRSHSRPHRISTHSQERQSVDWVTRSQRTAAAHHSGLSETVTRRSKAPHLSVTSPFRCGRYGQSGFFSATKCSDKTNPCILARIFPRSQLFGLAMHAQHSTERHHHEQQHRLQSSRCHAAVVSDDGPTQREHNPTLLHMHPNKHHLSVERKLDFVQVEDHL